MVFLIIAIAREGIFEKMIEMEERDFDELDKFIGAEGGRGVSGLP